MAPKVYDKIKGSSIFKRGLDFCAFRVKHAEGNFGLHSHEFHELVIVLSGKAWHKTLNGKRSIRRGHVLFVAEGDPHGYLIKKEIEIVNLLFSARFAKAIQRDYVPEAVPGREGFLGMLSKDLKHPFLLGPAETVGIELAAEALIKEYVAGKRGFEAMIRSKFSELLVGLSRIVIDSERSKMSGFENDERVARALKHVAFRYAGRITLAEMAADAGLNPSYFSALFRRLTGYSVFEYISEYRIYKACELLRLTKKPVLEIAFQTGFNNISLFNRVFKRVNGCVPLAYRRSQRPSGHRFNQPSKI